MVADLNEWRIWANETESVYLSYVPHGNQIKFCSANALLVKRGVEWNCNNQSIAASILLLCKNWKRITLES